MRSGFFHWALSILLLATGGPPLFAQQRDAANPSGADVALVSLVSGDVIYIPKSGAPGKVRPFMKVRDSDRIDVAAGSQVRIVFLKGARQELWTGPASFRAENTEAVPISGKVAEVKQLPAGVPQRLARIPELIQNAKFGGMTLRRLPGRNAEDLERSTTLSQARADYEKMRQDSPADDISPELYLYAALFEFRAYTDMKAVVAEMQRKQPDNQDVKVLDTWLGGLKPQ